jgi:hypothetical protein
MSREQLLALAERVEKALFDSIVHGLRSHGWSRIEAEGEALARIDRARQARKASQ